MTEASSKIRKARVSRREINKKTHSTVPLVKAKGERTKFPRITEALEAQGTELKDDDPDSLLGLFNHRKIPASKPKMKLERIQVQQINEMNSLVIGQTKSILSLKPETQGSEKKCKVAQEVEKLCLAEEIDVGIMGSSSSIKKFKRAAEIGSSQKDQHEWQERNSARIERDSASKVTITTISSSQKKRKLSLQTIKQKRGLRNWLMKLADPDYDTTNSTTEDAIDNQCVEYMPWNPSAFIEDVVKLSLNGLKTTAENQ